MHMQPNPSKKSSTIEVNLGFPKISIQKGNETFYPLGQLSRENSGEKNMGAEKRRVEGREKEKKSRKRRRRKIGVGIGIRSEQSGN